MGSTGNNKGFVLNFGVKWFKLKLNFCFCEGNRFSKLNNYRQVVIGEEQLESCCKL